MSSLDFLVFGVYMAVILGVGLYHFRRNSGLDDYYVGGRQIGWKHVGLSVVATDVGGGFSIGLGGLGYVMGLAGSWLLFTGLVGAWLAAVLLVPRVKQLDAREGFLTYPDLLRWRYGSRTAAVAALISGIGYLGFTGAQMLAGAKLASATIFRDGAFGLDAMTISLLVIAGVTVLYTVLGGIKAVIHTDAVQWAVLLGGLLLVALPLAMHEVGGFGGLRDELPPAHFDLTAVSPGQITSWFVTIIPIWFVAMTLYQRIYACADTGEARKAWYLAGLLEWPAMAFAGVLLGMCARVLFPGVEPETGLPRLVAEVLPVGAAGLVIAAYFSAIMSTADSCMMAASGNFVGDFLARWSHGPRGESAQLRASMISTALIGVAAVLLAARFERVLDMILHAYTFMVAGLLVPTLGVFWFRSGSAPAAITAMLLGGFSALTALFGLWTPPLGVDATLAGIVLSGLGFVLVTAFTGPGRSEGRTS
jgi:SSS family solute:Na+ symporter